MQYISINNQTIAYSDNKANSQPLVFVHGNSLSSETFLHQFKDQALNIPGLWKNQVQIIPGSGHCPQLENPKEFNLKLNEFLDQIL